MRNHTARDLPGRPAPARCRGPRAGALALSAALMTAPALPSAAAAPAVNASTVGGTAARDLLSPGPHRVGSVTYDLGDQAWQDPEYEDPVELAAVVHYPRDLGRGGPRPLVVQLHGSWLTCADREADAAYRAALEDCDEEAASRAYGEMARWPCAPGVPPLPSERGYDYLGENLASHGFVVVSIRANAINAGSLVNAYPARAHLINKHLAMWRELASTGRGPLAGTFRDTATGAPEQVDFKGRVDLTNVGTMGHSRGGKAVMWQASDKHRGEWPAGVRIKAVVPLAPVFFQVDGEDDFSDDLVTTVPFASLTGTCDLGGGRRGGGYFDVALGKSAKPVHAFTVEGANHDFFNTQWSPESGQVQAYDDAEAFGDPADGLCRDALDPGRPSERLTEQEQRKVGTAYIAAFFRRHLNGEKRFDPVLRGEEFPLADVAAVDVRSAP